MNTINKKAELRERVIAELGPNAFEKTAIWGTYGKDGKGPLEWVLLHERETDHLQAILRTGLYVAESYRNIISKILKDRNVIPESFDHDAYVKWATKMIVSPDTDLGLLGIVTGQSKRMIFD